MTPNLYYPRSTAFSAGWHEHCDVLRKSTPTMSIFARYAREHAVAADRVQAVLEAHGNRPVFVDRDWQLTPAGCAISAKFEAALHRADSLYSFTAWHGPHPAAVSANF